MLKAKIKVDKDYQIGEIDKRIYGSFIEEHGRLNTKLLRSMDDSLVKLQR